MSEPASEQAVTRFHIYGIVRDLHTQDEVAFVSVTLEADDDGEAQTSARELFDELLFSFDVTEIEEVE